MSEYYGITCLDEARVYLEIDNRRNVVLLSA